MQQSQDRRVRDDRIHAVEDFGDQTARQDSLHSVGESIVDLKKLHREGEGRVAQGRGQQGIIVVQCAMRFVTKKDVIDICDVEDGVLRYKSRVEDEIQAL